MELEPTVMIVDDDEAVRDSLGLLMKSMGLPYQLYSSAIEFLASFNNDQPGCLIVDIRMPKMSGLELQQELNKRLAFLPIVFITGHGDVPMAVQAMQQGAVDFLQKPFRDQDLLDRVQTALEQDSKFRTDYSEIKIIQQRFATLTDREVEILKLIVDGKANKVIAIDLELSQRTVELHRSHIMDKMQTRSLAQLVQMTLQVS